MNVELGYPLPHGLAQETLVMSSVRHIKAGSDFKAACNERGLHTPACWTEDKGSDFEPSLGFTSGTQEPLIEQEKCLHLKVSQSTTQGFQSGSFLWPWSSHKLMREAEDGSQVSRFPDTHCILASIPNPT